MSALIFIGVVILLFAMWFASNTWGAVLLTLGQYAVWFLVVGLLVLGASQVMYRVFDIPYTSGWQDLMVFVVLVITVPRLPMFRPSAPLN